ncbi:hypothetical protein PRIPAC_83432 [Pristionchus pacificus]|uniref:THAP-type domain-containing protein n=1 Tax=Pristionchus pacificus TaxID=54126 RepID=H3ESN1_PRIPA|nr:hypothetical protein PRIPAC_83138 [Pristionchus pacificus]KAF8365603.1 hypothetical protein PRIPAC_83432 [Pristionchus pacificus]|eukprot:PDM69022.1 hypothetical protein PRIPAC_47324 [Pristionchus pacificus]
MDHLPDPAVMKTFLSSMSDKEAKDNELFSTRVDLEEAAKCTCTCCPPRDQLEQFDFCCQSLFLFPLKKKGQLLRDGLKEKLKAHQSPCITQNPLFTDFLLTDIMQATCVVCLKKNLRTSMRRFASNIAKREQWVNALCSTPEEKKALYERVNARNPPMLCEEHFKDSDFSCPSPDSRFLNASAIPFNTTPTVTTVTSPTTVSLSTVMSPSMVPFTPPSTPHFSFPPIGSTPHRRPRSTTRSAMTEDVDDDPTWTPPAPTTDNEPDCEYLLVSKESLMGLLRHCTVCKKGKNNLSFRMEGLGFTCTRECNLCGMRSPWENSKPLYTANRSSRERLPKINVDIVAGTVLTAMGGTKLRQIMMMSGIHSLSTTTFHRIKRLYVAPAIEKEFVTISSAQYMAPVRGWLKTIIRRCYHAVLSSNGNGDMASEKFRAILLCMQNQHDFSQDASFKHIKGCEHGPPSVNYIFIPRDGKIVNRLVQKVFTERNIEDIKRVSHRLNTSPCESINALACRYAPKDSYFSRSGHEMRTQETMVHWNHLKHTAADGTRPVVGRKSYVNPTHKNVVWRNVRKAATHTWRDNVKQLAYEVRKNMTETPYATEKKERHAIAERKREIDRLTRPLVPSNADPNLEEEYSSEDEEEVDGRVDCPLDPLDKHLSYVDDFNLEQTDIEDEDEDEEEE